MPANAAAWYMAKRKFYMNQSFDQQLLPFLLKKYPEKFKVVGSSVVFLEVYKKDVAKAKLKYLVQYGLNAYFSHKADEYGVYFFDPFYYENTEPFHESLRQCITKPDINNKSKLVFNYFSSAGLKEQFKFQQHSAYGDYGDTALFCCKSLYKDSCKTDQEIKAAKIVQDFTLTDINNKSKLVINFFSSAGLKEQFKTGVRLVSQSALQFEALRTSIQDTLATENKQFTEVLVGV